MLVGPTTQLGIKWKVTVARHCRDCSACTRPFLIRITYVWWLWMFSWLWKPFMRTCPQCRHSLGKHQRRPDGSYKD